MANYRKMRPNHSTARPTQMIVIACDSTQELHPVSGKPVSRKLSRGFASFCRLDDGKPSRECGTTVKNPALFWRWVLDRLDARRTTWIVGHGVGVTMQLLGLFHALDTGVIELDFPGSPQERQEPQRPKAESVGGLFVTSDPPVIVGIRDKNGKRATIVDTRNYVDASMSDLADWTRRERKSVESAPVDSPNAIERLAVDCDTVRWFMLDLLKLWDHHDLGKWRWTVGGLSMAAFRHRFMPVAPIMHDDSEVRELERRSYRGGEIRVPYVGSVPGTAYQVDVTSLYPKVMRDGWFPQKLVGFVRLPAYRPGPPPGDPAEQIAEVAIDTGLTPFSLKTRDGSMTVCGRFQTVLAGIELDRACTSGMVRGWRASATYKLAPLFREYVDGLWPIRQRYLAEGNMIGAKLFKLLLVSLYGKFGQYGYQLVPRPGKQAPRKWQSWHETPSDGGKPRAFISVGWHVFEELKNDTNQLAAIAISSFVTAIGRAYMDDCRATCGNENVFYQSTDSMILNRTGLDRLRHGGMVAESELGKFRIEAQGENTAITGAHDYAIGGKRVAGWKSQEAVALGDGRWIQTDVESLHRACRHEPTPGAIVNQEIRQRLGTHCVATILPDGWTTPHALDWGPTDLPT